MESVIIITHQDVLVLNPKTMTRKIPIISLEDFEAKAKKPTMMRSLVLKHHDIILSVPKTEWKTGLKNAMDYYIGREEYEECSKIKKLIKKL